MTTIAEKQQSGITQEKQHVTPAQEAGQYKLWQILAIWLAGGVPMWVLGWLIFPAFSRNLSTLDAALLRFNLLTMGLVWQFVLSMIILYREEGNLHISTIRRRFWLNNPVSPKTGRKDNWLWWLLIPFILLVLASELVVGPMLNGLWIKVFPFLAEPPAYSLAGMFAPELRAVLIGAWGLMGLYLASAVFTILGEELLFRGVLLPKMNGVFGRWDWVANAGIFGLYHLHQPWGMPANILLGLILAFSSRRFCSNWFPMILHSGQSVYFSVLILGAVLGLA